MADQVQANEEEMSEGIEMAEPEKVIKDRKFSWAKLRRVDSLHLEAGRVSHLGSHATKVGWGVTLRLAFQSIGVVYGDIGTSPLYVYASTFPRGINNTDDILGILSLIIYTLILIPMVKYVFIVLRANDNGDGGTFALYSLICRYAKVSMIPNEQVEDIKLSNYRLNIPSNQLRRAEKMKEILENSKMAQMVLFLVTILGTSMLIGDGVLTPCISVLSAVSGIKEAASSLAQEKIVIISIVILILLFAAQHFGTDKVGYSFAPVIVMWFTVISLTGLYNIFKHDLSILRAFNPKYIIDYFRRNGKDGWISLGGVVLCITGTEAMFADLGHFSVKAIQISFSTVVLPALLCAYCGQAAYLKQYPNHVLDTFYKSIPRPIYWPTFVIAVAAAIIASQAMISGAFAVISQSLALGCFPRVKVVHTSSKYEGQVYIPEINYLLMIACVIVTAVFRTTEKIGNAYGIAVVAVMVITTFMVTLIMLMIWKTSIWAIGLFFVVFSAAELLYLSSVMYKFVQGGYLPIALSFVLMMIMGLWHYVHKQRYMFELKNKVSSDYITDLAMNPDVHRVPGMGFLYSELVQGIPPIFPHFIANIPSIHSVLVFISIKSLPISKVLALERFLFRQVGPREYRMFRCIVRYGYNDKMDEPREFECQLVEHLKTFVQQEQIFLEMSHTEQPIAPPAEVVSFSYPSPEAKDAKPQKSGSATVHTEEMLQQQITPHLSFGSMYAGTVARSTNSSNRIISEPMQGAEEEMQFIQKAMDHGVVYLLGETEVIAELNSSIFKKIVVNYVYDFIRKNLRQGDKIISVPRSSMLRVGMTYEI